MKPGDRERQARHEFPFGRRGRRVAGLSVVVLNIDTIATAIIAFPPTSTAFGCADTDNVRVRTIAASSPTTLANRGFLIWFED